MPRYIPTWNNPDDSVHTAAGTAVGACLVGSIGVGVLFGLFFWFIMNQQARKAE